MHVLTTMQELADVDVDVSRCTARSTAPAPRISSPIAVEVNPDDQMLSTGLSHDLGVGAGPRV
jgi:hypothetical protein